MKRSFAVRLSLRFMFILTTSVFLLSISFLYAVRSLVQANQTENLIESETQIVAELSESLPQLQVPAMINMQLKLKVQ